MSTHSLMRIRKEVEHLDKNPWEGISLVKTGASWYDLQGWIQGPKDTVY